MLLFPLSVTLHLVYKNENFVSSRQR